MPVPPLATSEERNRFIRYTRMDRWPLLARFPVSADLRAEMLAEMVGASAEYVNTAIAAMESAVAASASELMEDVRFQTAIEELPLVDGDRLVAVGDSVTADRLGWFELLAACLRFGRREKIDTINLGLSGDATTDVLERLDLIEDARPTWVLSMLGTNDVRYHGRGHAYRMVTIAETERNLLALKEFVTVDLGARLTFLSPPPADQELIDKFFRDAAVSWRARELDELAGLTRKLDATCVDVHHLMKTAGRPGMLDADGVHPTVEGQLHITRMVVEQLAKTAPGSRSSHRQRDNPSAARLIKPRSTDEPIQS